MESEREKNAETGDSQQAARRRDALSSLGAQQQENERSRSEDFQFLCFLSGSSSPQRLDVFYLPIQSPAALFVFFFFFCNLHALLSVCHQLDDSQPLRGYSRSSDADCVMRLPGFPPKGWMHVVHHPHVTHQGCSHPCCVEMEVSNSQMNF